MIDPPIRESIVQASHPHPKGETEDMVQSCNKGPFFFVSLEAKGFERKRTKPGSLTLPFRRASPIPAFAPAPPNLHCCAGQAIGPIVPALNGATFHRWAAEVMLGGRQMTMISIAKASSILSRSMQCHPPAAEPTDTHLGVKSSSIMHAFSSMFVHFPLDPAWLCLRC